MQGVPEGSTIRIFCRTRYRVEWRKNGQHMPKHVVFKTKPNLIKISNALSEDSGLYQCEFRTDDGKVVVGTSELKVGGIMM